jgi:hypothetical protein
MVYKYLHSDRIPIFDDFLIRFTQPKYLNDPEDCLPLFRIKDINNYVTKIADRNLFKAFSFGATINNIAQMKQGLIHEYSVNPNIILDVAKNIFLDNVNNVLGILCLSKSPFIKLLWSYYCDSYKGFVLEFNEKHEFFNRRINDRPDCGKLYDVKYEKTRPIIYVDDLKVNSDMFITKIEDWKHEQEVRLFRELKNCDKKLTGDVHLFQIPKAAITKVIFGLRFDPKTQLDIVKKITKDPELSHVNFGKMIIDDNGQLFLDKI